MERDSLTRRMLTNVPTEPKNNAEKAQVYRLNQWLRDLSDLAKHPYGYGLNLRGRPRRKI